MAVVQDHEWPKKCFFPTVIPEEVKPKFVKGKKRYGRRSRPDKPESALSQDSECLGPSGMESSDLSPSGIRSAKLRRSTSLESIEVRYHLFCFVFFYFLLQLWENKRILVVTDRGRYFTYWQICKCVLCNWKALHRLFFPLFYTLDSAVTHYRLPVKHLILQENAGCSWFVFFPPPVWCWVGSLQHYAGLNWLQLRLGANVQQN